MPTGAWVFQLESRATPGGGSKETLRGWGQVCDQLPSISLSLAFLNRILPLQEADRTGLGGDSHPGQLPISSLWFQPELSEGLRYTQTLCRPPGGGSTCSGWERSGGEAGRGSQKAAFLVRAGTRSCHWQVSPAVGPGVGRGGPRSGGSEDSFWLRQKEEGGKQPISSRWSVEVSYGGVYFGRLMTGIEI